MEVNIIETFASVLVTLVLTGIAVVVMLLMPKRLSWKEIYITLGVLSSLNLNVDLFFSQVFPLYYLGESPRVEFYSIIVESLLGPSLGIIFLNFMPVVRGNFWIYLSVWLLFSLLFEWFMTDIVQYLVFIGWRHIYSIPCYVVIFMLLRWHLWYIRGKG